MAMDRVRYVLLLSVLLAAVSPGRAAPIDASDPEWIEEELGPSQEEEEWEEGKIGEDNLLTRPQNDSQPKSLPEAEIFQAEWTNVNITQEESDYDNGDSQEEDYESEEPWWEEDDDWVGEKSEMEKPKEEEVSKIDKSEVEKPKEEEDSKIDKSEVEKPKEEEDSKIDKSEVEKPKEEEDSKIDKSEVEKPKEEEDSKIDNLLWDTWPVTDKFWWEPKPETGKQDLVEEGKAAEDPIPWWWGGGITGRPPKWGRPELKQIGEKLDMKAGEGMAKQEKPQWWAWDVTKEPWEAEPKAEDPWWEVDANVNIPQDKPWFPTKKQEEAKVRPDDSDEYDTLDIYVGNDEDTREDLEEIPVQQEIFPPEMKENTVTFIHEKSGSGYFWAFLATLAILVAVLFMVYHKKRLSQHKRFIFALEGGLVGDTKRPNSGDYQRLDNKI